MRIFFLHTCAQAYKRAALRYHPDKAVAEEREDAEKKFKQVGAAHAILSDPAKRQKYDAGEQLSYSCCLVFPPYHVSQPVLHPAHTMYI